MDVRKLLSRKEMKLLTLLLTSMLIASASAAVYYSLTMTSTIEVYKANVYFKKGGDDGQAGLTVTLDSTNTTATLSGVRAYPNATFTYTDPVRVRNNSTSSTAQIRLSPDVNPSANPGDFVFVKFLLNATNPVDRRWLNYTSSGSSWTSPSAPTTWVTVGTSTEWSIVVYTKATTAAVSGHTVIIGIKVDVQ